MGEFRSEELVNIHTLYLSVFGTVSHIAAPLWVSFPVFLLLLLVGSGHDLSVSFDPGVQSQDALEDMRRHISTAETALDSDTTRDGWPPISFITVSRSYKIIS